MTGGCSSPTATRGAATPSTSSTTSCGSCTTTVGAGCATARAARSLGGARSISAQLDAVGEGIWTLSLHIDGVEVGRQDDVPLLYGIAPFEGIDVGIDRRSPVSWDLYERFGAFPWSGTLRSVTFTPGADAPDSPANLLDLIRSMGARFE